MTSARQNWLDSLRWQSDFYRRGPKRERTDPEFDWPWYSQWLLGGGDALKILVKRAIGRIPLVHTRWHQTSGQSTEWLEQNAAPLWGARSRLEDDLSKLLFDMHLVLRTSNFAQFYFPRIDFDDFAAVSEEVPFQAGDLPTDYLGLPLRTFSLKLAALPHAPTLKVISTKLQIQLTNSYRQYLVRRPGVDLCPSVGDVVLDCGACIGDFSILFAAMTGERGEVHLFDPVPLHSRYIELQGKLNPSLAPVLNINVLAVGETTRSVAGTHANSARIAPGGLSIDSFSMTTLDDYAAEKKLRRLDVIKMDIEGAERAALAGAAHVLRDFGPKLSISAYHLPDDLWVLPERILANNPRYKLYFGHHSPVSLESVFYAVQPP